MAKKPTKPAGGSLADKLRLAGVVSGADVDQALAARKAADAEAARTEREAARATGSVEGICRYYLEGAPSEMQVAPLLAWGAAWYDEMQRAGHGKLLDGARPAPCHPPASDAEIADAESALGFSLPPSARRFLREVGGVRVGATETLAAAAIATHLEELRNVLGTLVERAPELSGHAPLQLAPWARTGSDYDFVLRNVRDAADESPIYFAYHDDSTLYGGAPNVIAWLEGKLTASMERALDRSRRAAARA